MAPVWPTTAVLASFGMALRHCLAWRLSAALSGNFANTEILLHCLRDARLVKNLVTLKTRAGSRIKGKRSDLLGGPAFRGWLVAQHLTSPV